MRPIAIGLTAALALAALIPAAVISAPKAKDKPPAVDPKAREVGMKAAPDIAKASGISCTVTDARLVGSDKKTNTDYYEVACQEGLGFALVAKKDAAPQTYNCLETAQAAADGKPSALACILPGNADPKAGLTPYLAKAATTCEIENARAIGAGAKNAYFEVACKGGAGYIVTTSSPVNIAQDVAVNSCLLYEEGGNVSCKLTDRATQLSVVETLNTAAGKNCAIKDKRYVLSTKTDNYFEVACQDGKGYVLQQAAATGAFVKAIDCAQAGFVGGGCTLSDAVAAQTEQAGLYSKLSAKAGFDCKVEKYGMLPSQDPRKEIVELKCSNRPDGGIGIFTATSNTVYDCVTAEMNGYRCSFTKPDAAFPRLTADLKAMNKGSCTVSGARVIGQTPTQGYVEVACSDGLPGWVLVYPLATATPKPADILSCLQAKGVGGGCKLPTNATKG
jgi:hypothetical protein